MSAAAPRRWTVLELLRWTTEHFGARGIESARLDAECLLAFALETNRVGLYIDFDKPVNDAERGAFRELVRRRADERVPVSLLVGEKEFWSLSLRVTPDVLTPRPETETLVSAALEVLSDPEGEYRIAEIGTGSGAIALALLSERPKCQVSATDISPAALQIAAANADRLQLGERVHWLEGNLYQPLRGECFDLVVSNPPYLARSAADGLPPELGFEPEIALFGGEDGLAVLKPLVEGAAGALREGGTIALEIDPGQAQVVGDWCTAAGLEAARVWPDAARRPRVVTARRPRIAEGTGDERGGNGTTDGTVTETEG